MNWSEYKKGMDAIEKGRMKELEIVAQLISRRKELGITQRELSDKTGLHQSAIARFEREGVIPRLDTLDKIAKALGLRITLVEDENAATNEPIKAS